MHGAHRDLPVLTHSFPPRRSSDLTGRLLAELAEKAAYLVADGLVRGRCLTGWLIIGFDRLRLRNDIGDGAARDTHLDALGNFHRDLSVADHLDRKSTRLNSSH